MRDDSEFVPTRFEVPTMARTYELEPVTEDDAEARARLLHRSRLNVKDSAEMGHYIKHSMYLPSHLNV